MTESLKDKDELWLLTACIWAEARGEPVEGQEAVCNVIVNQVRKRMGGNIKSVILAPFQFSWTIPSDPNFKKVFYAEDKYPQSWNMALMIAQEGIKGELVDNTMNADHYLNLEATMEARQKAGQTKLLPRWVDMAKVTVKIHNHTFFNLRG